MDKGQVLNRVYESSLPSRAKTVMFYLVNRSNKELICFPAIPTIARETGLNERTVQRALKELVEEGFVEKTPRYRENGGQSSNLYRLDVEKNYRFEENTDNSVCPEIEGQSEIGIDFGNGTNDDKYNNNDNHKEGIPSIFQITDFFSLYNLSPPPTSQYTCHREGVRYVPP
jgi:DNA-binding transcriptional MocR family regulator